MKRPLWAIGAHVLPRPSATLAEIAEAMRPEYKATVEAFRADLERTSPIWTTLFPGHGPVETL